MTDAYELDWLGLEIGNSRLHWSWFKGERLVKTWDSKHISKISEELMREILPHDLIEQFVLKLPLYLASVVPAQTAIWQNYPNCRSIEIENIPLRGIYPTLGVDRALAAWGSTEVWGCPCLVIDGGTALTFTGVDRDRVLVGGAILPGLRLQLISLSKKTAALPEVTLTQKLPNRWANNTRNAIESGIIYTAIAGVRDFILDWRDRFPDSKILLRGGDANLLLNYLQILHPEVGEKIIIDPNLVFWGMRLFHFSL